jgi:transcriptional regulator with XRE-family HTH domain
VFDSDGLVRLRKAWGLSQEELARRSGLATVTIAKLEEGRIVDPKASTLLKLARALGCQVDALLREPAGVGGARPPREPEAIQQALWEDLATSSESSESQR